MKAAELLGPEIEQRHTNYDGADASRRIAATGFPNGPEFDMLNPRSPGEDAGVVQQGRTKKLRTQRMAHPRMRFGP